MTQTCNLFCTCHVDDLPCYQCVYLDCTVVRPGDDWAPQPSAPELGDRLEFSPRGRLREIGPVNPTSSASTGGSFEGFRPGKTKKDVGSEAPGRVSLPKAGHSPFHNRPSLPPPPHPLARPFTLPSCPRGKDESEDDRRPKSSRYSQRETSVMRNRNARYEAQWEDLAKTMASLAGVQ
ncbi:uncharacterized protein [Penaeus vannamei]|uniref:uncharacterized protein n=1 Tax=Penaeus vannamei TaxID=6689 RepID=UPI00387F4C6A